MSKERDLLERWVMQNNFAEYYELREETVTFLAQPEQEPKFNFDLERMKAAIESPISDVTVDDLAKQVKQEPVAWMSINNNGGISIDSYYANHRDYVPLYTAPPKRTSLGLEIMDVCGSEDYREGFKDGALYAEKCHGIGGE